MGFQWMRPVLRLPRRLFCASVQAVRSGGAAYDELRGNEGIGDVCVRLEICRERFHKLCKGVERMRKAPREYLDPVRNGKIMPVLDVLDGLKMSKNEQCKLVAAFPRIFFLTKDLVSSKLRWLAERLEMSNEEVVKVVVGYPHFLDSSIDNKLEAMLDLFRANGFSTKQLKGVLVKSPWVMSLPVEGLWNTAFHALEKLKLTKDQQVVSLGKAPLLMNSEHEEETGSKILWLSKTVGVDPEVTVARFVVAQADILYGTALEEMKACYWVIKEFGYSVDEIKTLVQRDLHILSIRVGDLRERLDFIHNVVHKKLNDPRYLKMNFEDKLMTRVAFLIHKRDNFEELTLRVMWSSNHQNFVNAVALTSMEEYDEYCKWFKAFPKKEKLAKIMQERCSPHSGG